MENMIVWGLGAAYDIEQAEYFAHEYACRFFLKRRMTMGLVAYLSTTVCPIVAVSRHYS